MAYEVYVLDKQEINQALNLPPLNFWQVIKNNQQEFLFWTLVILTIVVLIFLISISRLLERKSYPLNLRTKKYLHGYLALETIRKYQLTKIFPFQPFFLVLGAFVIEILLGIFFILGIKLRFTSLFFLVFLALSVWPHLILIGAGLVIFLEGYDDFTLEKRLFRKDRYEPVL